MLLLTRVEIAPFARLFLPCPFPSLPFSLPSSFSACIHCGPLAFVGPFSFISASRNVAKWGGFATASSDFAVVLRD